MKWRLDQELVKRGLVSTRSQAESFIKLGKVNVNKKLITKPGQMVNETDEVTIEPGLQYVSRAALKLDSVASLLGIEFENKVMLDVGSSTGGFTDYALKHGAKKVIAVDVGTAQLHPSLHGNERIELHEKTDIRDLKRLSQPADLVVIDVSFISLREVLPTVIRLAPKATIIAMVKPQFEAENSGLKHKGVIKNDAMRRQILRQFEVWVQKLFVVINKADSGVAGAKGNRERFYKLVKK